MPIRGLESVEVCGLSSLWVVKVVPRCYEQPPPFFLRGIIMRAGLLLDSAGASTFVPVKEAWIAETILPSSLSAANTYSPVEPGVYPSTGQTGERASFHPQGQGPPPSDRPCVETAVVQKIQKRRRLWNYGKGSAFTTFPQHGGGGVMSTRTATRRETDKKMHTGHFYFVKN